MARDANLPQLLGTVHPTKATPHFAILFSAILIVGMAVALPIEDVAAAADIMFLLLFVQVNIAVMRLRKSRPDLDRGFRIPFMPVIPILAIGTMLFLAVFLFTYYPMSLAATGGWILAGAGVYYGYARTREAAFVERAEWMDRIERKEYRVLVAVSSPQTVENLLEAALPVAKQHHGELVVMSVAEVPEGETLLAGRPKARELEPLLERAATYARERGVPARPVIKIARRVSHGIVETAREEECNFIIIGQPSRQSFVERLVSTVVERVLHEAPCQVAIVYGRIPQRGVRGIVLPTTKGMNTELAAELAPAYTAHFGTTARAITVIPGETPPRVAETIETEARETLSAAGFTGDLTVLQRADVVVGLARALRPDELVIMGAPSTAPVAAMFGETVPVAIAHRGRHPVIVVRDVEPHRARHFERLFFRKG
jgi:nucleotide-binding universal stress UspA family protein